MTSVANLGDNPSAMQHDTSGTSEKTLTSQEEGLGRLPSDLADVPSDGGYGWVCVAAVFLVNAHTWGLSSISKFDELSTDSVSRSEQCMTSHYNSPHA